MIRNNILSKVNNSLWANFNRHFAKKTIKNLSNDDIYDLIDGFETTDLNVKKAQEAHFRDEEISKNIKRHQIIKSKYFKPEKEENFLSWSQKQTIKFLHNSDPDKWDIETLAENYPITITGLKKLINADWIVPRNFNVVRHDRIIAKKWQLLMENKLNLDPSLQKHIKKFAPTQHQYFCLEEPENQVDENKRKLSKGEFSNFINQFENNKSENKTIKKPYKLTPNLGFKESYLYAPLNKFSPEMTIDDFKKINYILENSSIEINENDEFSTNKLISYGSLENQRNIDDVKKDFSQDEILYKENDEKKTEKYEINSENSGNQEVSKDNKILLERKKYEKTKNKFKSNQKLESYKFSQSKEQKPTVVDEIHDLNTLDGSLLDNEQIIKKISETTYKEKMIPYRIKIPQEKYKRGATYKVDDTFYADDGSFLYRVPGLK